MSRDGIATKFELGQDQVISEAIGSESHRRLIDFASSGLTMNVARERRLMRLLQSIALPLAAIL